ncbi:hypothetical protein [Bacillus pinisoli]|uniref:TIGR03943 family putative permease subunit n=1 Tax=Bacillus pinisoli TaxID=2901866 RepID=UPI001FF52912|nr:hypothetical protein [Bacillus pinisoli]
MGRYNSFLIVCLSFIVAGMSGCFNRTGEESTDKAQEYLSNPEQYMERLEEAQDEHIEEHVHEEGIGYEEQMHRCEKELEETDEMILSNPTYFGCMMVLDQSPDQYVGKVVKFKGFIYREPDFTNQQFVIGQQGEDGGIYGLLTSTPEASKLSDHQWVEVRGVLSTTNYINSKVPFLDVLEIREIDSPQ